MAPKKGECHTQWLVTIRILDERDSNTRMSMNDWWLAMIIAGCRKRSLALLICSFLTAVASSKAAHQTLLAAFAHRHRIKQDNQYTEDDAADKEKQEEQHGTYQSDKRIRR